MMKLIIAVMFFFPSLIFGQTLLMESEIKTQSFGGDTYYKDLNNNPLDGHYKIADDRGNYSDLHFIKGKKDGEIIAYDYDGRLLKKSNYKNGKTNGAYTTYHQNGKVRNQGNFVNGKQDGEWENFDDKGELKNIESYKNGKKDGKWWAKVFIPQDQTYVFTTEYYKDDQHVGHAEEIGDNGKLKWEKEYIDDENYTHKRYYPNGKISHIQTLKDSKLEGEELAYNQDGILLIKRIFKADQRQQEISFYESGNKEYVYNYVDSKKSGLHQRYNEEGIMIVEGTYKSGYKDGIWKEYDGSDERLLSETTFVDDAMNGVYKKYNAANRVGTLGFYKNNEQDGMWKYYNLAEKLIKEVEYNLGREISSKEYK